MNSAQSQHCTGGAIVGFIGRCSAHHSQSFLGNAGRCRSLIRHRVVTQVGATVAAGQQDGLGCAHVLVVGGVACVSEVAGGGNRDVVTCDHAAGLQDGGCDTGYADGCHCAAVIGFVTGCDAGNSQSFLDNACGRYGLIRHRVVTQVGATVVAGQKHCLGSSYVLVVSRVAHIAEVAGGGNRDVVTCDHAAGLQDGGCDTGYADGSSGAAVVGFVSGGDAADSQSFLGNAGRCRSLVSHRVVAQIGATVAAGQQHCFSNA